MEIISSIHNYNVKFLETKLDDDFYLVDKKVYDLYKIKFSIPEDRSIIIEANEDAKSFDRCAEYIEKMIILGIKRGMTIGVIGGGVLQDISGFICGILYRGVFWNFYPTTLLSQCDSCIGGKTSINFKKYKNTIGSFNPPLNINIDTDFLNTLTSDQIQSGIGEIIKVSFLDDKKRINEKDILDAIEKNTVSQKLIKDSLEIKKEIIEIDEFDKGLRNIMNYGHTFGHAIESVTNFKIPHGIAVVIGINIANKISKIIYNIDTKEMDLIVTAFLFKNLSHFNFFKNNFDAKKYLTALSKDKKNINSKDVRCIIKNNKNKFEIININKIKLMSYIKEILE